MPIPKWTFHSLSTALCFTQALIYFLNPLSLSFACSRTSSGLQTAKRSQSSTVCALASVKNSVGGMAATPSSLMQNQDSLKSRGRLATCGGKG